MPTMLDLAVAFLLVLASIYEYRVFSPRLRADVVAERPGARTRAYRRVVLGEWVFALGALAIWASHGRPWSGLRLTPVTGWRVALAIVFVLAAFALLALQLWSVARLSPDRRVAVRPKLGDVTFFLPRTREEEGWFIALSITAGFCEELLYRGYLPWFMAPWIGSIAAMAVVVLIFGASHLYLSRSAATRATLTGAVLAAIVLATNSLVPAMIVHALIDIGGGTVGYWLLREGSENGGHPSRVRPAPTASSSPI